jgi:hypothetical protein
VEPLPVPLAIMIWLVGDAWVPETQAPAGLAKVAASTPTKN